MTFLDFSAILGTSWLEFILPGEPEKHACPERVLTTEQLKVLELRKRIREHKGYRVFLSVDEEVITVSPAGKVLSREKIDSLS